MPFAKCGLYFPDGTPRTAQGCTRSSCKFVHPTDRDWDNAPEPRTLPRFLKNAASLSSDPHPRPPPPKKSFSYNAEPDPPPSASWDLNIAADEPSSSKPAMTAVKSKTADAWGSVDEAGWGSAPAWGASADDTKVTNPWASASTKDDKSNSGWGSGWGSTKDDKSSNNAWGSSTKENNSSNAWGFSKDVKSSTTGWGSAKDDAWAKPEEPSRPVERKSSFPKPTPFSGAVDNGWGSRLKLSTPTEPAILSSRRHSSIILSSPTSPTLNRARVDTDTHPARVHYAPSSRQSSVVSDAPTIHKLATPIIPPLTPMAESTITSLTKGPKDELKHKVIQLFTDAFYISFQIEKVQHHIEQYKRMNTSQQFGHVSLAARDKFALGRKNYDKSLAEFRSRFNAAVDNLSRFPDLEAIERVSEEDVRELLGYARTLREWMERTRMYVVGLGSAFTQEKEREKDVGMGMGMDVDMEEGNDDARGVAEEEDDINSSPPPPSRSPSEAIPETPLEQLSKRASGFDTRLDDLAYRLDGDGFDVDTYSERRLDSVTLPQDPRPGALAELEEKIGLVDDEIQGIAAVGEELYAVHTRQEVELTEMMREVRDLRTGVIDKCDETNRLTDELTTRLEEIASQVRNLPNILDPPPPSPTVTTSPTSPTLPFTPEQLQAYADFLVDRFITEELEPALTQAREVYASQANTSARTLEKAAQVKLQPFARLARQLAEKANSAQAQNVGNNKNTVL